MAHGDFSRTLTINQQDEIGRMADLGNATSRIGRVTETITVISEVNNAATGMAKSSFLVEESAENLSTLAKQLQQMVTKFKV